MRGAALILIAVALLASCAFLRPGATAEPNECVAVEMWCDECERDTGWRVGDDYFKCLASGSVWEM